MCWKRKQTEILFPSLVTHSLLEMSMKHGALRYRLAIPSSFQVTTDTPLVYRRLKLKHTSISWSTFNLPAINTTWQQSNLDTVTCPKWAFLIKDKTKDSSSCRQLWRKVTTLREVKFPLLKKKTWYPVFNAFSSMVKCRDSGMIVEKNHCPISRKLSLDSMLCGLRQDT